MKVNDLFEANVTAFTNGRIEGGITNYLATIGGTTAQVKQAKDIVDKHSVELAKIRKHPSFGKIEWSARCMLSVYLSVDDKYWRIYDVSPTSDLKAFSEHKSTTFRGNVQKHTITLSVPPLLSTSPNPVQTICDNYERSLGLIIENFETYVTRTTKQTDNFKKRREDEQTPKTCFDIFSDRQRKLGVRAKDTDISNHTITSLEGCPARFDGALDVGNGSHQLKSLEGGPEYVGGMFSYGKWGGQHISAIGGPKHVRSLSVGCIVDEEDLNYWETNLDAPVEQLVFSNYCVDRLPIGKMIKARGFLGITVGKDSKQKLSLKNLAKEFGHLGIIKIGGQASTEFTNVLSLALVDPSIVLEVNAWNAPPGSGQTQLVQIIKKYTQKGKSVLLDFQNELIEAGYPEAAKL